MDLYVEKTEAFFFIKKLSSLLVHFFSVFMGLLVLNLLLNDLHLLEAKINIICTFYISFLPDPCYLVRGYHCEVGFFSLLIVR